MGEDQGRRLSPHQAVELAEQLGDLYCKVGCYSKALDAYQAQVKQKSVLKDIFPQHIVGIVFLVLLHLIQIFVKCF